jgi:hypothetical protein
MAIDRQKPMIERSTLERAICAKLAAVTSARIQSDIERMSNDLRQQGADDDYIAACAERFAERNQQAIVAGAREIAELVRADGVTAGGSRISRA